CRSLPLCPTVQIAVLPAAVPESATDFFALKPDPARTSSPLMKYPPPPQPSPEGIVFPGRAHLFACCGSLIVLKGHGFSRAVKLDQCLPALAAEGCLSHHFTQRSPFSAASLARS